MQKQETRTTKRGASPWRVTPSVELNSPRIMGTFDFSPATRPPVEPSANLAAPPSTSLASVPLASKVVREGSVTSCRTFHTGQVRLLLEARDTQGALALIEAVLSPGEGSPRHIHRQEDEVIYVQRGRFRADVGAQSFDLHPGDTLLLPRDVPHVLACTSAHPGAFLCWIVKGGSEARFLAEDQALTSGQDHAVLAQQAALLGLSMADAAGDGAPALVPGETAFASSCPLRGHEGGNLNIFHDCVRILVASEAVHDRYCFTQIETQPLKGIPCHVHATGHEAFFVQAGRYEFCLDDARVMAHEGDVVWVPAGVTHHFRVVSSSPGKLLLLSVPGGFDRFSRECAVLFARGEATPSSLSLLGADHDIYLIPPRR